MRSLSNFFVLFLLIFTISVRADEIDKYVGAQLAEQHVPGAAIAVVKNGKVIKIKGYGLASIEFNAPVTTETVFEIGSVSKQITAAAVMLLVEDGKINLDEKISKYLPNTPETWKDVSSSPSFDAHFRREKLYEFGRFRAFKKIQSC